MTSVKGGYPIVFQRHLHLLTDGIEPDIINQHPEQMSHLRGAPVFQPLLFQKLVDLTLQFRRFIQLFLCRTNRHQAGITGDNKVKPHLFGKGNISSIDQRKMFRTDILKVTPPAAGTLVELDKLNSKIFLPKLNRTIHLFGHGLIDTAQIICISLHRAPLRCYFL